MIFFHVISFFPFLTAFFFSSFPFMCYVLCSFYILNSTFKLFFLISFYIWISVLVVYNQINYAVRRYLTIFLLLENKTKTKKKSY